MPEEAFEQLINALSDPGTGLAIAPLDLIYERTENVMYNLA
ncbi:hypothetical protein [Microcoleus sp.]